jgi:asparagine synthase (glutamine-hydrolysing)
MCGLSGYIGKINLSKNLISETLISMRNRGPDHQGHNYLKSGDNNIYLLSSRLKIVDRSPRSNQPMSIDKNTIVYNGEIYNIKQIKEIIAFHGLRLKTNSDTELILQLYKIFGTNCVNYLEGMWAFAIFDKRRDIVFISRDRIGEKPLYFYRKKNGFYFGSETKFIRILLGGYKELNHKKIYNFLKYGYKSIEQTKETFFKNLYKIEAGSSLIIKNNLSIKKIQYWAPKIIEKQTKQSACEKQIRESFTKSIKDICNSDLKIGLSLSGGVDSNYILSFIKNKLKKKIHTYSIIERTGNKYNEENLIDYVVKKNKISNKKIYLDKQKNLFLDLKKLINYHDKPISTISYFLQSIVYKKMKSDGIKISLGGTGADELFSGYYHHYKLYYQSLQNKKQKITFLEKWKKHIMPLLRNKEYTDFSKDNTKTYFTLLEDQNLNSKKIKPKYEKKFTNNPLRNKLLNELIFQTVPLALVEEDLNAMYNSIENRSPFLNKDLVDLSFRLPSNIFMKDAYNKYLLRMSAKNILLDKVRLNREKKGFNASFSSIFSFENKKFREWFYDENKKNPIYNYLDRKFFLHHYKNNIKKTFPDVATQSLFNICSTKVFLEEINT